MTTIEKHIVKFIEDKFGFPYLYYDKVEQTWANEFFLFDIKSGTMYVSDETKDCLLYTSPSPRDRQKSRMPSSA